MRLIAPEVLNRKGHGKPVWVLTYHLDTGGPTDQLARSPQGHVGYRRDHLYAVRFLRIIAVA